MWINQDRLAKRKHTKKEEKKNNKNYSLNTPVDFRIVNIKTHPVHFEEWIIPLHYKWKSG